AFGMVITIFIFVNEGNSFAEETNEDEGQITTRDLTYEETVEKLINVSKMSEEEAIKRVYGNNLQVNPMKVSPWKEIKYSTSNYVITGHIKTDTGRIVDAAPTTSINVLGHGWNLTEVSYSTLTVI